MKYSTAKQFLIVASMLVLNACTTVQSTTESTQTPEGVAVAGSAAPTEVQTEDIVKNPEVLKELPKAMGDLGDKNISAEIPVEVNNMVLKWMDYWTGKGRKWMELYLSRSARYFPTMKKILRDRGLPEDLVYVALIESGFSYSAKSWAGAVGYWQFIRSTGKRYGLTINNLVDERRDPISSTQAAADYFTGLYNLFGSWYLAMASYNVGEGKVSRLVMKHKTRDFWELAKRRGLPKETINYVPKFIAATIIAKEPEKYGFNNIEYHAPLEFDELKVDEAVDLKIVAQKLNVDYEEVQKLNPRFRTQYAVRIDDEDLILRVPKGQKDEVQAWIAETYVKDEKQILQAGSTSGGEYVRYRIRRGDTLSGLAARFGTSIMAIRSANDLGRRTTLRVGQRLSVPAGTRHLTAKSSSRRRLSTVRQVATNESKVHVVARGDTLIDIAQRYNVSVSALASANKIRRKSRIMIGDRLNIP